MRPTGKEGFLPGSQLGPNPSALKVWAGGLSLQGAIDFLVERGVESLLIEGGAQLNYSALAQGLVDEILLTIMPFISGDKNAPAFADGPKCLGDPFLEFELLSCETVSTGELFLHYRNTRI